MKTIQQHLEKLKEPYKTKAIQNTHQRTLETKADSLIEAIKFAFLWENTLEGFNYWDNVHSEILLNNENYFNLTDQSEK